MVFNKYDFEIGAPIHVRKCTGKFKLRAFSRIKEGEVIQVEIENIKTGANGIFSVDYVRPNGKFSRGDVVRIGGDKGKLATYIVTKMISSDRARLKNKNGKISDFYTHDLTNMTLRGNLPEFKIHW